MSKNIQNMQQHGSERITKKYIQKKNAIMKGRHAEIWKWSR